MSPSTRTELEKDFQNFLKFCEDKKLNQKEIQQVCEPLLSAWRWRIRKTIGLTICVLGAICWLGFNVEVFNWTVSALGRLILIEMLSFWNWTPLYTAKCLVDKSVSGKVDTSAESSSLGKYETDSINCVLCENFERLPSLTNATYSMLEKNYLEKGLPVIIQDSHSSLSLENILSLIFEGQSEFLSSQPCNVQTNLLMKKFFSIRAVLEKIVESSSNDEWFLQFRNCQFDAVKASRKFIRRPYYYPLHFEPFYSSWLLMSNKFIGIEKELYLQGLVLVQQLSGEISITLVPKSPCGKSCPEMEFRLLAGEGLVFSTDLWIFNYKTVGTLVTITTIMEIDWNF